MIKEERIKNLQKIKIYNYNAMDILIDETKLDPIKLNLHKGEIGIFSIKQILNLYEISDNPNDEIISWLINAPPIYASLSDDEMKKHQDRHTRTYFEKREESIEITKLIKKEFYSFFCTKSKTYAKERKLLGGDINLLITGLTASIASHLTSISGGIIATIVTFFILLSVKMTTRVACQYMKETGL